MRHSRTSHKLSNWFIGNTIFGPVIMRYCNEPRRSGIRKRTMEAVTKMASERPVVIFSKSSCCISHSIKTLLCDFGVNPAVYELDEMQRGREIEQALSRLGCNPTVPAVFIGGELVGGANEVMSLHLKRSLIPMLMRVGALWV
ncbi:monothiol glutaredoxin-S2 [Pyrus ussuriensis x Pyrus communis]|uniref:Monothiol glutaredoxin-S2 n=2 Tax=Pyrus TaxID=3766 RepID=A0A5N5F8R4_9ROSA|nr:monothiol glutaredoxin-S2 [Pyrus ussuriensis x Pyrus communis]